MSYKAPVRSIGRLKRPFGNLYYEVSGSGPALLFAHGLGGNQMSWWQQVAHFRRTTPVWPSPIAASRRPTRSRRPRSGRLRRRPRGADRSSGFP